MGHTLAEKIIMHNTGLADVWPGDLVVVKPDFVAAHDIYTEILYNKFHEMGFQKVWDPEKIIILNDHDNPACLVRDPASIEFLYKWKEEFGIRHIYPNGGITHQLIPELGYAKPGRLILVTDSHTPTYGAVGCFSTGIGYTEMSYVFGKGELWLRVPSAIKIEINGQLPPHVCGKDIILRVLGDVKAAGGTYMSLEFMGSTIDALSVDDRLTIANMVVECGGKAGLFAADEKTAAYSGMDYEEVRWVRADEDACYEKVLRYAADDFEPYVACPPYVDNVKPLREVTGTQVSQVFLGSCTNGRLQDLAIAASVLRGRHVAKGLKLVVTPASNQIYFDAMRLGYIQDLVAAGAMVTPAYCSFCEGRTMALLCDDETAVGTNNRNFLGRYGSPKAKVYLASPEVAAWAALKGQLAMPE